jgi:hypothetical protein
MGVGLTCPVSTPVERSLKHGASRLEAFGGPLMSCSDRECCLVLRDRLNLGRCLNVCSTQRRKWASDTCYS